MEDNKISHSFWAFVTWVFTILCWTVDHIGAIAGAAAVAASFFSIRASRATEKLRLQEQQNLAADRQKSGPVILTAQVVPAPIVPLPVAPPQDRRPPGGPPQGVTPPDSKSPDTET